MSEPKSPWTADREAMLRELWARGMSASEVAREIGGGVTRNSVIGKITRLKIQRRDPNAPPGGGKPRKEKPPQQPRQVFVRRVSVARTPPPVEPPFVPVASPFADHWTQRGFGRCAYLIDDTQACCNPVAGDEGMSSRYCAGHMAGMVDWEKMRKADRHGKSLRQASVIERESSFFTRHERLDTYDRVSTRNIHNPIETIWDEGRAVSK